MNKWPPALQVKTKRPPKKQCRWYCGEFQRDPATAIKIGGKTAAAAIENMKRLMNKSHWTNQDEETHKTALK